MTARPLLRHGLTVKFDGLANRRTGQAAQQRDPMIGRRVFGVRRGAQNECEADDRSFHETTERAGPLRRSSSKKIGDWSEKGPSFQLGDAACASTVCRDCRVIMFGRRHKCESGTLARQALCLAGAGEARGACSPYRKCNEV